jgi:hypothetical protein
LLWVKFGAKRLALVSYFGPEIAGTGRHERASARSMLIFAAERSNEKDHRSGRRSQNPQKEERGDLIR